MNQQVLFIHYWITIMATTLQNLQKFFKHCSFFSQTYVIWSHILRPYVLVPRTNWINCLANSEGQRCRRGINSACATFVIQKHKEYQRSSASVSYPDIKSEQEHLFRQDDAHLSKLDNRIFINIL